MLNNQKFTVVFNLNQFNLQIFKSATTNTIAGRLSEKVTALNRIQESISPTLEDGDCIFSPCQNG